MVNWPTFDYALFGEDLTMVLDQCIGQILVDQDLTKF